MLVELGKKTKLARKQSDLHFKTTALQVWWERSWLEVEEDRSPGAHRVLICMMEGPGGVDRDRTTEQPWWMETSGQPEPEW